MHRHYHLASSPPIRANLSDATYRKLKIVAVGSNLITLIVLYSFFWS